MRILDLRQMKEKKEIKLIFQEVYHLKLLKKLLKMNPNKQFLKRKFILKKIKKSLQKRRMILKAKKYSLSYHHSLAHKTNLHFKIQS